MEDEGFLGAMRTLGVMVFLILGLATLIYGLVILLGEPDLHSGIGIISTLLGAILLFVTWWLGNPKPRKKVEIPLPPPPPPPSS